MRMLITLMVGYVLVCLLAFTFQRKLLYLPSSFDTGPADLSTLGMIRWPGQGADYLGLAGADPAAPVIGNVVVFHGNAGSAADRSYYLAALQQQGFRVFINEYPGYGGRPGSPSETAITDDAVAFVRAIARTYPDPIYLWGESLGAGVVGAIASEVDAAGVVLLTPWDTLPNVAQANFWFLPARWLVLDRYDTVKNLAGFAGPKAVIIAQRDEVIAPKHGRALYASLAGPKRLWEFAGAGHNSWPAAAHHAWWSEVSEFLSAGPK